MAESCNLYTATVTETDDSGEIAQEIYVVKATSLDNAWAILEINGITHAEYNIVLSTMSFNKGICRISSTLEV